MRINKIQNNEANKNHIKFKGNVSPEFVRYVREIQQDCSANSTTRCSELFEKVCDNIINKSKIVMEQCFHPFSILSIDNSGVLGPHNDALFIQNEIINKHLSAPDLSQGFLSPKGQRSPRGRLNQLNDWIYGFSNHFFHEAFSQNMFYIDAFIGEYNIEAATELIEMLSWGRNRLNTLTKVFPNYEDYIIKDMEAWREFVISKLNKHIEDLSATTSSH